MRLNRLPNHKPKKQTAHCLALLLALVTALFSALSTQAVFADGTTTAATDQRTILVLGDSISAGYGIQSEKGWVNLLQNWVNAQELGWAVVNASISGETTGGGLARLPELLSDHDPDIVLIELGGNDGLRGYPTSRMRTNLEKMVALSSDIGAQPVLMAMRIPPNYGPRYTRAFEKAFQTVSDQAGIPLIPFFLESIALESGMMQADGIHPTADAQPQMLESVLDYLAPLLK